MEMTDDMCLSVLYRCIERACPHVRRAVNDVMRHHSIDSWHRGSPAPHHPFSAPQGAVELRSAVAMDGDLKSNPPRNLPPTERKRVVGPVNIAIATLPINSMDVHICIRRKANQRVWNEIETKVWRIIRSILHHPGNRPPTEGIR